MLPVQANAEPVHVIRASYSVVSALVSWKSICFPIAKVPVDPTAQRLGQVRPSVPLGLALIHL